jgi:hypothetical protein
MWMVKKTTSGTVADPVSGKPLAKDVATPKPRKAQGAWTTPEWKQGRGWTKKEVNKASKNYRMVLCKTDWRITNRLK